MLKQSVKMMCFLLWCETWFFFVVEDESEECIVSALKYEFMKNF